MGGVLIEKQSYLCSFRCCNSAHGSRISICPTQEDVANAAMSMIVTTFSDQFDITYDYDGDSQCLGVKLVLKDVTAEIWNSYPSDTNVQLLDAFSGITDVLINAAIHTPLPPIRRTS